MKWIFWLLGLVFFIGCQDNTVVSSEETVASRTIDDDKEPIKNFIKEDSINLGDSWFLVENNWSVKDFTYIDTIPPLRDSCARCLEVRLDKDFPLINGETLGKELVLFYLDTTIQKLYGNPYYFGPLHPCNAIHATFESVGIIKNTLFDEGLDYSDVSSILLHSEIISSYMHLYALVWLQEEAVSPTSYAARYAATHHYCTNDCYDHDYKFSIDMHHNGDGYEISVSGN